MIPSYVTIVASLVVAFGLMHFLTGN